MPEQGLTSQGGGCRGQGPGKRPGGTLSPGFGKPKEEGPSQLATGRERVDASRCGSELVRLGCGPREGWGPDCPNACLLTHSGQCPVCLCVGGGGGVCAGRGGLTARIWLSGAPAGCPSSPAPRGPPWPPSPGSKDALRPGEGASLGPCKGPPPAPSPSPGPGVALIELNCGPHQPPPLFPALAPDRAPAPIFPTPSSPTCLRACLGSAHLH